VDKAAELERSRSPVRQRGAERTSNENEEVVVAVELTNRATPAVAGVDVSLPVEQQAHDLPLPLAGRDVQRRTSVEVDAVDVHPAPEQLLDPGGIPLARGEEQAHGGVQVLRHRELLVRRRPVRPAARRRVERRLPGDREPRLPGPRRWDRARAAAARGVRVQRQLAPQPRRPRRELPRDAPRHLLRRRVHRSSQGHRWAGTAGGRTEEGVRVPGGWWDCGRDARGISRAEGWVLLGIWGRMIGRGGDASAPRFNRLGDDSIETSSLYEYCIYYTHTQLTTGSSCSSRARAAPMAMETNRLAVAEQTSRGARLGGWGNKTERRKTRGEVKGF
jgi:hypothetical protein